LRERERRRSADGATQKISRFRFNRGKFDTQEAVRSQLDVKSSLWAHFACLKSYFEAAACRQFPFFKQIKLIDEQCQMIKSDDKAGEAEVINLSWISFCLLGFEAVRMSEVAEIRASDFPSSPQRSVSVCALSLLFVSFLLISHTFCVARSIPPARRRCCRINSFQ
jgi:hypothetical protein